jgi:hypothetical protein
MSRTPTPPAGYLIKYLSTARGTTPRYFEVHGARAPREAVSAFQRLFPAGIVVDVHPPALPPEVWRDA